MPRVYHDINILEAMTAEVKECNQEHGWYEFHRTFGDDVALLHSEVSEALEAFRDYGMKDVVREDGKPLSVGSEFADVLIRLLDTCDRYGIDLFSEWLRKMDYNWNREYRHGGKAL